MTDTRTNQNGNAMATWSSRHGGHAAKKAFPPSEDASAKPSGDALDHVAENAAAQQAARPSGTERRRNILSILREANAPLSGETLGKKADVSRQVIVNDIALLRTEGFPIISTNRGYLLSLPHRRMRALKCHHSVEETENELTIIVDLGGEVVDVAVNHRVYGKMSAMLNIASRRDVRHYIDDIQAGKSSPLMLVTSGYHFHHIAADSEEALDEIEAALQEQGYLAEVFPYESELVI